MKKTIQRTCGILAVFAVVNFSLFGCGLRDQLNSQQEVNKDRTQLYIGLGTNGLTKWMNDQIEKFEAAYADVSFEEGKKGVQVFFQYDEKFSNFDTLPKNYTGYQEKLIITENIPYTTVKDFALDITDLAISPLNVNPVTGETEGEETASIADKMLPQFKEYYGADDRYYALPAQECALGLVYDADLFDEYGLYFANAETENFYEYECENVYTGETGLYRFVDGAWDESDLAYGPDGEAGTFDDGLPATYEEFFALCDYMYREYGVEPVRWAGKVQSYLTSFLEALAAEFEGDEYLLKTNFNGTAHNLVKFDEQGKMVFDASGDPETYSLEITGENGYMLTRQEGFYQALKFLETLMNSPYYDKDQCVNGTSSHLTTQSKYLLSKHDPKVNTIAMLIEGSWWYGEADSTFTDMAQKYGEKWSAENRRFRYLPIPKVSEEEIGSQQSTIMCLNMSTFITDDIDEVQEKVAKLFLKNIFRREGLLNFMRITGQMRPYTIELTEEEYGSFTEFGRSNYDLHTNTEILFKPSYNSLYLANNGLLDSSYNFHWEAPEGSVPTDVIRSGYSAEEYFESINGYWTQERWDIYFKDICY